MGDACGGGGGEFLGAVVASRLVVVVIKRNQDSAAANDVAGYGTSAEILTRILEARRDGASRHARWFIVMRVVR